MIQLGTSHLKIAHFPEMMTGAFKDKTTHSPFHLTTLMKMYRSLNYRNQVENLFSLLILALNCDFAFPNPTQAVKCLDDSGCKIRNGLSITDEDLTLDTSIACDSCDIWYHAFCVGFDPERGSTENSWLCPRCVTVENVQLDRVPSKNISDNSFLKDGIGWISDPNFSSKLSVSVDDDGETAVVVSIIEAPRETNSSSSELDVNLKTSTNIMKPDEQLKDSLVCRSDPCISSSVSVLKTDDGEADVVVSLAECENMEQISTDTKAETSISDASACETKFELPVDNNECSQSLCDYSNEMISEPISLHETVHDTSEANNENSTTKPDGNFQHDKSSPNIIEPQHTESSDVLRESLEDIQANAMDPDCFNINTRRTEIDSEPQLKKAKFDGKSLLDYSKRVSNSNLPKNDTIEDGSPTKSNPPNIMSIVREDNSSVTKSLRVKKILRRDGAKEESFQKLREEIKEAARNKTSTTNNTINDFDAKLLTAFRAAVVKPKEESNGRNGPSSLSVKRNLLQKGKARENLTKKIYGTSTGKRRRAWDREWEIEFWKYRCNKRTKPEKIVTLSSVLEILKKATKGNLYDSETEEQDKENSILSRVYLADTSLFPRKDDIKPLSAIGESSETISTCSSEKNSIVKKSSSISLISDQTGSRKNAQSSDKEMKNQTDLSKIDKKKWAMEILARKNALVTASSSEGGEEDQSALKGKYPLLAQLPMEMRPVPEPSRHNKVPLSVRQAQLFRLTEHFLKATNQTVIHKTADTELAIADAVNIERGIFEKSSSKLVYINLCAQSLSQKSMKPSSYEPMTPKCSTPTVEANNQAIAAALKLAGLSSDSPPNSPRMPMKKYHNAENASNEFQNYLDMDSCKDLPISVEENRDEVTEMPKEHIKVLEPEGTSSAPKCNNDNTVVASKDEVQFEGKIEDNKEIGVEEIIGKDRKNNNGQAMVTDEIKDGDCSGNNNENCKANNMTAVEKASPAHSLASENIAKEKTVKLSSGDSSNLHKSITKKVEAYIKEHIRPLCKSGVITVEQYRWAVGKTTDKVMKYHHKAKDAKFLIKEGEKVKKLAEQYVEASQKKES